MNYSYLDRKENFADTSPPVYAGKAEGPNFEYPIRNQYGNRFFCSDMGLPTGSAGNWQGSNGNKMPLVTNPTSWGFPFCICTDRHDGGYLNCDQGWQAWPVAGKQNPKRDICEDVVNPTTGIGMLYNPIQNQDIRSRNRSKSIQCGGTPPPSPPSPPSPDKKWYCVNSDKQGRFCECAQYSAQPYNSQGDVCDSSKIPYDTQDLCKQACKAKALGRPGCRSCKVNT